MPIRQRTSGSTPKKSTGNDKPNGDGKKKTQAPLSVKLFPQDDHSFKVAGVGPSTPWEQANIPESLFQSLDVPKKKPLSFIRSTKTLFPLGLVLGALLAYFLISPLDTDSFEAYSHRLSTFLDEFPVPDLPNFSGFPGEMSSFFKDFGGENGAMGWMKNRDFQVGSKLADEGLQAKHSVILIPGIISTNLESWSTAPAARSFFRKRLWGSASMIRAVLSDKETWMQALALDPVTGLDPVGHKVRASQGFDAASQFIQGYWIWAKIIENLAPLNYDSNNLELAAYDWRLSYHNLELRDAYFSQLKSRVEFFKHTSGQKVVLVGHSLKWVEAEGPSFGNGGPDWVENHIESFVNIAGPMLGVAKAMAALLSGEMKDTVEVNPAAAFLLEKMFSRKERADLFRSWAGSASMWLKGGNTIWGNEDSAPDDPLDATHSHGTFLSFRHSDAPTAEKELTAEHVSPNLTVTESNAFMLQHTPMPFQKMYGTNYSSGIEADIDQLRKNNQDHTKWTNPLEIQLPNAPSLKIFCMYGHGKETERSYWYMKGKYEQDEGNGEGNAMPCVDGCNSNGTSDPNPLNFPLGRDMWIDSDVSTPNSVPTVRNGVKFGEGDGTVPLLSLGAMCVEGWKRKEWNPAGIKVVTREQAHLPEALDLRGGATTGEHVDILGSEMVNEAVGRIAAGRGHELEDLFVSNIREYAAKINWPSDSSEDSKKNKGFWG
ncbi:phospholipid:diacylglycerol acyltransferase [Phaffia rhodozyma]|uniref:Phospholipid:diacylglycerol acyltransferase n=1 Tax=Phaffia rhodozyma TaxID=264483 RepID=A0A0F7SFQ3_PHARH|nr:phospholipid:diacylglycerol acyltransferase [Phaffia rhodozyma]